MSHRRRFHESRVFEMANAGEEVPGSAMNAIDIVKAVSQLWIPQLWPKNVAGWFMVLDMQFKSARIVSDEMKYNIIIGNIQEQYMKEVEDIVLNPPATGRYELLKNQLIQRLTYLNKEEPRRKNPAPPIHASDINEDSDDQVLPSVDDTDEIPDAARKWRLFEQEQMGDRTPSQFFKVLKSLAIPSTPDDFLLAMWKIRLPTYLQRILDGRNETDPNILTKVADRVYEITAEAGRIPVSRKPWN